MLIKLTTSIISGRWWQHGLITFGKFIFCLLALPMCSNVLAMMERPANVDRPIVRTFVLWSISSTFYVCVFCMKVLLYFRQRQNVTREKLPKSLLYENGACKTLIKLSPREKNKIFSHLPMNKNKNK